MQKSAPEQTNNPPSAETPEKRNYRSTLNITLSDKDPGAFPQRGSLPVREPEIQKRWQDQNIYAKSLAKPAPRGRFVLHDGPPYSNGDIHLGTALNKIAKDIVTRYRTMAGFRSPYVPGWDNHGMPIENAVAQQFREKKQTVDRVTLRRACREYAAKWVDTQREQFQRLGVRGDWADPYLTMSREFEAAIVRAFGEMAAGGYVYRGLRPVLWCATCETALADAEVEYEPHTSNSIYVRFPVREDPNHVVPAGAGPAYIVIWTTTPWTIPANLALAVHPDQEYSWTQVDGETWLLATALIEDVLRATGRTDYGVLGTISGSALEGLVGSHPLFDRASPVTLAQYVTMDTGTGVVHTAPGHGKEDFETGQRYGLPVLCPVDASGRFTEEAGEALGQKLLGVPVTTVGNKGGKISEGDRTVIALLEQSGNLLSQSRFEHSYPHCWRCHSPLIFRATVQWFMNVDHAGFRERLLEEIGKVSWFPAPSVNRIRSMIANAPDWCLSRQRSWGVGIPAFHCEACGHSILSPESIEAVAELVADEGSDAWYEKSAEAILPSGFHCPSCGAGSDRLRKETDVLDVWFDSGSTHRAVLEARSHWPELAWPADLYLEGGDQHRGWFNSSLKVAVATRGAAPYRTVVTNGWTLDEQGHAMHKSKGNAVNPITVVEKYGADVLRWWVSSTDFMEDVSLGENVLKQVGETYRRVRNTFRFLLNTFYDYDPAADSIPLLEMENLDRWALSQLARVTRTAVEGYETYQFNRVYQTIHNFCAVELSSFYLDVLKDRLYTSAAASHERRSAQTAMYLLADGLARLLAPILAHTSEEVWSYLKGPDRPESVHLAEMPNTDALDEALLEQWAPVLAARETVTRALAAAKGAGVLTNPLEARVTLRAGASVYAPLAPFLNQLASLFVVSQVELIESAGPDGLEAAVAPAEGIRCARCWLVKPEVGQDAAHPDLCHRCARVVEQSRA